DGYTWETDLSEDETGLGISGQRLAGHFVTDEDEAGRRQLELRVESNGCTSAPRTVTLEQNARFADVCPRIRVVSRFGGEPIAGTHGLPAACLGSEYRASLTAEDASPSSEFREVSLPEGITFERNTATLGGVGEASGVVTVQVEDGETHRTIEQDFELELRERCWFAYLDSATGASRLNLIDAVLDNRRGFPAGTAGDPVSDFEFSPDGRFLAYRTGADPASRRLTILELRTFLDAVLDYESVTRYAWSQHAEGSSILAVAYGTGDARYLGGVDVTRAERDDSSRTIRFPKLAPGSAAVDSPLTWYAGSHVGFLSLIQVVEEDEYFSLSLASLADARFLDARSDDNIYFSGTRLQSAEDGLFLVPSSATAQAVSYLPADGSTPVLHHDVLLSPSGRFVARSEAGELKVFRSTQSSDPEHEGVFATSARCDSLLAWSAGDRVACADFSEQASPRIVTFDVDYDAGAREYRISKASEVHGSYEYPGVPRNVRQRVFSPTGDHFAFTTADALYVAEIGSDSSIQLTSPGADLPAMLVFSADGTRLLQHRGGTLALYSLEGVRDENPSPIATDLPEPSPCDEDFKAGAGNHCGEVRGQAAFSSSPDASQVAFRTSEGTLLLGDLRFEDLLSRIELTDACSAGCYAGERFAFQP
ncbi:MAG TPA: hypothetical protein VGK73_11905, partial [Polyangiaceae bacterium]